MMTATNDFVNTVVHCCGIIILDYGIITNAEWILLPSRFLITLRIQTYTLQEELFLNDKHKMACLFTGMQASNHNYWNIDSSNSKNLQNYFCN